MNGTTPIWILFNACWSSLIVDGLGSRDCCGPLAGSNELVGRPTNCRFSSHKTDVFIVFHRSGTISRVRLLARFLRQVPNQEGGVALPKAKQGFNAAFSASGDYS